MSETQQPWHKRPGENETQYRAFRKYLECRDITQCSTHHVRTVALWQAEHQWRERTAAYDDHLGKIADAAEEEKVRNARTLLDKLYDLSERELSKYLAASHETDVPGMIPPNVLARMTENAVKLGELIAGKPTERIAGQDLSKLSDDELRTLQRINQKLGS